MKAKISKSIVSAGLNRFPKKGQIIGAISNAIFNPTEDSSIETRRINQLMNLVLKKGTKDENGGLVLPLKVAVPALKKGGWKKANSDRVCGMIVGNMSRTGLSKFQIDKGSMTLTVTKDLLAADKDKSPSVNIAKPCVKILPLFEYMRNKPFSNDLASKALDLQIEKLVKELEPDSQNVRRVRILTNYLLSILKDGFSNSNRKVFVFGSRTFGLSSKTSDVDISITVRNLKDHKKIRDASVMSFLHRKMTRAKAFIEAIPIRHARVPIIKFVYKWKKGKLSGDISFNSSEGIVKSKFIRAYTQVDKRVQPFLYIIKLWAKSRLINESNVLNSYSLIMMGIAFLIQNRVVPPLQFISSLNMTQDSWDTFFKIQSSPELIKSLYDLSSAIPKKMPCSPASCVINGSPLPKWTTNNLYSYFYHEDNLHKWKSPNNDAVSALLYKFFYHFGFEFDPLKHAISPRLGATTISRDMLYGLNLDSQFNGSSSIDNVTDDTHVLAIEDPFEITHNCGRLARSNWVRGFLWEMRRACWAIDSGTTAQGVLDRLFTSPDQAMYNDIRIWAGVYNVDPQTLKDANNSNSASNKGTEHNAKSTWCEDDFLNLGTVEEINSQFSSYTMGGESIEYDESEFWNKNDFMDIDTINDCLIKIDRITQEI